MKKKSNVSVYIVHYSPLINRSRNLTQKLEAFGITAEWITENDYTKYLPVSFNSRKTLGVSNKLIGMDLGVNSRSLGVSRKRARRQGYSLYLRSFISRNPNITKGSLPSGIKLPTKWFELSCMHLSAIKKGISVNSDWILILEDDALPSRESFISVSKISEKKYHKKTWINLNSGAELKRTSSDPKPDENGLFRIKPSSTRCTVAYMLSKELGRKILESAERDGIPDWIPIDVYFQVMLRKFKAHSYWQEPATFAQGSETGEYKSQLEQERKMI